MFVHLPELYGLSVQLLASLDECVEMAGEIEGVAQCPQAGFVFEEIAEARNTGTCKIWTVDSGLDWTGLDWTGKCPTRMPRTDTELHCACA